MNTVINVVWDGPLSADLALSLNGKADYGIYQAYGNHPIYGSHTLLYIGRAASRRFAFRFAEHGFANWTDHPEIYVGRIHGEVVTENWQDLIRKVEALLIFSHAPAWNSSGIDGPTLAPDMHIMNWGRRAQLLPEVSSLRWVVESHSCPKGLNPFEDI